MTEWSERGILLESVRYGENHALAEILTEARGRWRGLVHGGGGRRMAALLQPGNEVAARWRGRLESHLGALRLEPVHARAGRLLGDPLRLAGLSAACALLSACLPEREPHPRVFAAVTGFLDLLDRATVAVEPWSAALVRLELLLLQDLGYGLDLSRCAATGATSDLVYVSPKSGMSVSREAGHPWRDRLLPLPAFLLAPDSMPDRRSDVLEGFVLTGHFLLHHVTEPHGRALPAARDRLVARLKS